MHDGNYKILRDSIYIGEVISPTNITINNEYSFKINEYKKYRNILFKLTVNNYSNDLLYSNSSYPVFDLSCLKDCYNSRFIINNAYNLSELLIDYNYNYELSLQEIIEIKNKFFGENANKYLNSLIQMYEDNFLPSDYELRDYVYILKNINKPFSMKKDDLFKPSIEEGKINQLLLRNYYKSTI